MCKLAIFIAFAMFSANAEAGIVNASPVGEHLSLKPHYTYKTRILFKLDIEDGWHIYWANPGDAGEETLIKLKSFPEKHLKKIFYSLPKKVMVHDFIEFGLTGRAYMIAEVDIPAPKRIKKLPLKFTIEWLACKDNCVPGSTDVVLDIPITGNEDVKNKIFDDYRKYFPSEKKITGKYYVDDTVVMFIPDFKLGHEINSVEIFPYKGELIDNKQDALFEISENGLKIQTEKGEYIDKKPLTALLKINGNEGYNVEFKKSKSPIDKMAFPYKKLLLMSAFAFLGGLILNLMPCVLPVLSLKAFSIINNKSGEYGQTVKNAFSYTVGILLSFIALGSILSFLNCRSGNALWGFQMQNPAFVLVMAYIFLFIGMMMSDIIHLNMCFGGSSAKSSFLSGILTVLVASPCTAPFMGAAVAWALMSRNEIMIIAVFLFLGLGLALPWLLIALFPSLCKKLPKPGEWMNHFKHALAFPIYATVIWLLWILMSSQNQNVIAIVLLSMLTTVFAAQAQSFKSKLLKLFMVALSVVIIIWSITLTLPQDTKTENVIEKYSSEKLDYYKKKNVPVLLKFSAKWCLTCMVNESAVFSDKSLLEELRKNGIVIMHADWTNKDKEIADVISGYGRSGVPLYVYYDGEKDVILPTIVTKDHILKIIRKNQI